MGPGYHGVCLEGLDDVVAVERAQRDELDVLHVQARQELLELVADFDEALLAPVHQVHLVHGDDQVRDAQQRGDAGVAAALLDDALARVHQHDGEVGGGGAGDHVARVLDVARRVGDDEPAARRGEVAVGDVNGDALLALGAQAVGEIGEVDLPAAGDVGGALQRFDLVFHQRPRVVEQPADESGLAVVHRAAGVEAENVDRDD